MMLAVLAYLPERTGPTRRGPGRKVRLTDRRLTPFLIFALAYSIINAIPIQTIAFYFIDRLGYSTAAAPGYVSIGLTAGAIASLFSQLVIVRRMRLPPARLMRIAPALAIGGHFLILVLKSGKFYCFLIYFLGHNYEVNSLKCLKLDRSIM